MFKQYKAGRLDLNQVNQAQVLTKENGKMEMSGEKNYDSEDRRN